LKQTAVARRYAKAFAESIGEPAALQTVLAELKEFSGVFERSKELRTVMLNPAVAQREKEGILDGLIEKMSVDGKTAGVLRHVLEKDRMGLVRLITDEFERFSFEIMGKVRVEVSTATELTQQEVAELAGKLSALSGKEAVISLKIDPSLIGGVVARIGSVVYDGSIKNQLKALRVGLE